MEKVRLHMQTVAFLLLLQHYNKVINKRHAVI